MARKSKLYALLDPSTQELRYIGKTFLSLRERLRAHVGDAKRRANHRANWIKSLLAKGQWPAIELLDEVEDGAGAEIAMIGIARSLGARLVNGTGGGEGTPGRVVSPETRAKISAANKGKRHAGWQMSEEGKQKISAASKGRPKSPAHRASIGRVQRQKRFFNLLTSAARRHHG